MPRTITIDNIQVTQLRVDRDSSGELHVYAEYRLKAGTQAIQAKYEEITARLSSQRKAAAAALFDGVLQDLIAELA